MVIKFKNRNQPDFQLFLPSSFAVQLQKVNNKITAEPVVKSKTIWYMTIDLIAFIVILITKIPSALLILWPKDKLRFIGRWIISNLLYLTFFILLFRLLGNGNYKYIVFYYGLVLIADFVLLEYWYKRESKTIKIALAALVSNLVFLTAGQLAITFILMVLA